MTATAWVSIGLSLISLIVALTSYVAITRFKVDKVEVETEKDSDRLEAKIDALTASIALISKSATEQAIINQFTAKMLDQMNKRIEDHERLINDNRSIFEAIIKLIEKFTASKS